MSRDVEIIEISPVKRKKYTVITGFTGSGFIGNTALMYVVRNKRFKMRAQVRSELIPPMMLIIDGEPVPVFRIYSDDKDELLFVMSEALIIADNTWLIGIRLMEWLREKGVKEIVSIEGMPFGTTSEKRLVFGFSLPERNLASYDVRATREGGVSGLNAVMLEESMKERIPWVTIFVPTPHSQTIDYGGAAVVIEVLNKMFKLGVDPAPLKRSADMRRQMQERLRGEEKRGFLDSLRRRRPDSGIA